MIQAYPKSRWLAANMLQSQQLLWSLVYSLLIEFFCWYFWVLNAEQQSNLNCLVLIKILTWILLRLYDLFEWFYIKCISYKINMKCVPCWISRCIFCLQLETGRASLSELCYALLLSLYFSLLCCSCHKHGQLAKISSKARE